MTTRKPGGLAGLLVWAWRAAAAGHRGALCDAARLRVHRRTGDGWALLQGRRPARSRDD